jgi:hypothetical protein
MKLPVYLHRTESAGVGTLYSNARRSSAAIPEPGELLSHEDGKGCSLGLQNRSATYPKRWQSLMTTLAQAAEVFLQHFPKEKKRFRRDPKSHFHSLRHTRNHRLQENGVFRRDLTSSVAQSRTRKIV